MRIGKKKGRNPDLVMITLRIMEAHEEEGVSEKVVKEKVREKQARRQRLKEKFGEALNKRQSLGVNLG